MDWTKILEAQNLCTLCKHEDDCSQKPSEHYDCWEEKEECKDSTGLTPEKKAGLKQIMGKYSGKASLSTIKAEGRQS